MTFDEIFAAYYTLYRGESEVPDTDDDEYTIALRYANEALTRWANYDATYWKELFATNQESSDGVKTLTAGVSDYAAPTNMREAGGYVQIKALDGTTESRYPIIDPQDAQFRSDTATYCYFTGNNSQGFTLHLNATPSTEDDGKLIEYVYYKTPTQYTTGTSKSEVANPYFVVQRMLAMRFRVSRNYSSYQTALRDSEEYLKNMQQDNNSGTWANPWKLEDRSGAVWGQSSNGSFFRS